MPQEWGTLTRELREARSLAAIKRESKREFFSGYAAFKCSSTNCGVSGIEAKLKLVEVFKFKHLVPGKERVSMVPPPHPSH